MAAVSNPIVVMKRYEMKYIMSPEQTAKLQADKNLYRKACFQGKNPTPFLWDSNRYFTRISRTQAESLWNRI